MWRIYSLDHAILWNFVVRLIRICVFKRPKFPLISSIDQEADTETIKPSSYPNSSLSKTPVCQSMHSTSPPKSCLFWYIASTWDLPITHEHKMQVHNRLTWLVDVLFFFITTDCANQPLVDVMHRWNQSFSLMKRKGWRRHQVR